jgi:hypothetical protein
MSSFLLGSPLHQHCPLDDLESIYWVLLFNVYRCLEPELQNDALNPLLNELSSVFTNAAAKTLYLLQPSFPQLVRDQKRNIVVFSAWHKITAIFHSRVADRGSRDKQLNTERALAAMNLEDVDSGAHTIQKLNPESLEPTSLEPTQPLAESHTISNAQGSRDVGSGKQVTPQEAKSTWQAGTGQAHSHSEVLPSVESEKAKIAQAAWDSQNTDSILASLTKALDDICSNQNLMKILETVPNQHYELLRLTDTTTVWRTPTSYSTPTQENNDLAPSTSNNAKLSRPVPPRQHSYALRSAAKPAQ